MHTPWEGPGLGSPCWKLRHCRRLCRRQRVLHGSHLPPFRLHLGPVSFGNISLKRSPGQPRWRSGLAPPAAQGVILETLDRVPRQAFCMEPASPSAGVSGSPSLSVSL